MAIDKIITTLSLTVFAILLFPLTAASAQDAQPPTEPVITAYLNANNVLYSMKPDGSDRKVILQKAGIQDFVPLSDGRILIHSKEYDGDSLAVYEPDTGVSVLIEFSEGVFTNIAVSEDNSTVAYEVKHLPISTEGDGVWLYQAEGHKSHIKISGSALTIESISINRGRVYMLYHEMDLISDEAGLFLESYPVDGKTKPRKNRIKEGLKLLIDGGYTLGYAYSPAGKKLEIGNLDGTSLYSIDIPAGDIHFDQHCFIPSKKPKLIFTVGSLDSIESGNYVPYIWDVISKKSEKINLGTCVDVSDFIWSQDEMLYFTGGYEDPSGEKTGSMLFKYNPKDRTTALVSVPGGKIRFLQK
jgi:hypothetical protein